MKIQFIPGIDTQLQQILRNDLAVYESRFNLTDDERHSLYEWVSEGNAACDNPWYMASENGAPMDFVTAMRTVSEILKSGYGARKRAPYPKPERAPVLQ